MTENIWTRLATGQDVHMAEADYATMVIPEYNRSRDIQFDINQSKPSDPHLRDKYQELLGQELDPTTTITSPSQIDFGNNLHLAKDVFINHSLTVMSIGGIFIDEGTFIGPNVTIVTDNHALDDLMVLRCLPVHIGKNVWVGANATILPGVTVGDGAVIASGAIVTKDVPAHTIVAGCPAKIIREK